VGARPTAQRRRRRWPRSSWRVRASRLGAEAARWWWLLAPLVVALGFRTVTRVEFVGDAQFLLGTNRRLDGWAELWGNLTHDYFWSSSGAMVPYWRPLTKLCWLLEHQLFGAWAGGYALVQLGWHLLAVMGIQLLAVRLGVRRGLAIVAGVLFGLHPVAIAPVCMLMARSDVVCAAASIWAVATWWLGHESRTPKAPWLALHGVAVLAALGSKETAVILPALLAGFSLLLGDWRRAARANLWLLAPSVGAVLIYLPLRAHLLAAEAQGLSAVRLGLDPLRVFASSAMYLRGLVPFALDSGVRNLPIAEARSGLFWLTGGPALACTAALAGMALWRRDRALVGSLLWVAAALAPVLLVAQISVPAIDAKFPLDDRWLYHALAPATLVWAAAVQLVRLPWLERAVWLGAGAWSTLLLWRAPHAHAELSTVDGMLDNEDRAFYFATPEPFRTAEDHCRFHERRLERGLRRGDDSAVVAAFADMQAQCERIAAGRFVQARSALVRLAEAARAGGDLGAAAQELGRAYVWGGQRDPSLLLAAATFWLDAGNRTRAEGLLQHARTRHELSADQRAQAELLDRRLGGTSTSADAREPMLVRP
jgi:hypothetical protein